MKQKRVYVIDTDGYYIECPRIGTVKEFNRARYQAAIAADELKERGQAADIQTVYNALVACDIALMDARTEITSTNLYASIRYIEDCKRAGVAIYWPYVQNRILDFLEPEYISKLEV